MVANEEVTIKMLDGSACEVISTMTVNVIGRDETVHTLEAVRYILKPRNNLICIRVLNSERCGSKCNIELSRLAKKTGYSWRKRSVEGYTS